eukprot:8493_1
MTMAVTFLFILLIVNIAYSSHQNRKTEFSRVSKYELIHIEPRPHDEQTKWFEFDAFNQHYKVELVMNNHMIAANIRHANIDPTKHKHQYFSSMTESCHYHGYVSNSNASSVVAVSLCPKRGIRGRITAFNETLIIYPSAYYLDLDTDKKCDYKLSDELIVYRLSDFTADHIQHNDIIQMPMQSAANRKTPKRRRRLYTASEPAYTEMLMITGPVRTRNYKEDYAEQWYQQLLADLTEMVNAVSAIYKGTDFGANVGRKNSITVVFKELEVIEAFDGIYKSLKPHKLYTNCELSDDAYDDTDLCAINGQDWLGTIQDWVYNNKDVSTFDHAQFMSDLRFKWSRSGRSTSRTLGWGNVGAMCRGSASVSDVSVVSEMGGNAHAIRTMAHELGHNYGMSHDGQPGEGAACPADAGLMGYSDGAGFSTCSIASMQKYFARANGLTCLGTGWNGARAENRFDNADIGIPITTSPTTKQPTTSPTRTGETLSPSAKPSVAPTRAPIVPSGCIRMGGFSSYFYDGVWMQSNDLYYEKQTYYFTNTYNGETNYLYFRDDVSFDGSSAVPSWYIGSQVGSLSVSMYCPQEDLYSCAGQFKRYNGNGWGVITSSTVAADCTQSPSKSPVSQPTQSPTTSDATPNPTQSPTKSTTATPTRDTISPTVSPTKSPVVASGCVRIDGIDDTFYNGVWIETDDSYNDKPYYIFRNAYGDDTYLYFRDDLRIRGGSASPSWFISSAVGSTSINAFCSQEDLLSCSGEFNRFMRGGWSIVSSSMIDTDCTSTPTCDKYQCLLTTGIPGYNGRWSPSGCINHEAYYTLSAGNNDDKYICFATDYRWIITTKLCSAYGDDLQALTLQETGDILDGGGWFVSDGDGSGSFTQSLGATISECNAHNALTIDDLSCLDDGNGYDTELCVYSNNTVLWNGYNTFERAALCHNDEAVYLYIVYDDATEHSVESVYYLFFHKQLLYSDSNETVGQWLISKGGMSVNSLAFCEKDELLECTGNEWKVRSNRLDDVSMDGLLFRIVDKYLTVSNGRCEDLDSHDDGYRKSLLTILCITVVGAMILIGFGICGIILRRDANQAQKVKVALEEAQGQVTKDESVDGEEEIVLDVSVERDGNYITYYDA